MNVKMIRTNLFNGGASPDVQEVSRLSPVQLDDVHRSHGQSRPVDQTADVAVQPYVVDVSLLCLNVALVFL